MCILIFISYSLNLHISIFFLNVRVVFVTCSLDLHVFIVLYCIWLHSSAYVLSFIMHVFHVYSHYCYLLSVCVIGPVQTQVLWRQWITLNDVQMESSRQMSRLWAVIMNVTCCSASALVWSGFGSIPASFPELKPHSSPRLTPDPSRPLSTALLSVSVSSRPNRALALLSRQCECVCVWMKRQYRVILHVVFYTKMTCSFLIGSFMIFSQCAQVYLLVSVYTKKCSQVTSDDLRNNWCSLVLTNVHEIWGFESFEIICGTNSNNLFKNFLSTSFAYFNSILLLVPFTYFIIFTSFAFFFQLFTLFAYSILLLHSIWIFHYIYSISHILYLFLVTAFTSFFFYFQMVYSTYSILIFLFFLLFTSFAYYFIL